MTQKQNKRFTPWIDKFDSFSEKLKINGLSRKILQWLMRQTSLGKEFEIDLDEYNTFLGKDRGKKYDQQYLKKAFEFLESTGIVRVVKKYSWKVYRIICIPLEWLSPPRKKTEKNSESSNLTLKTEDSNQVKYYIPSEQQQQEISYSNKEYLETEGFYFDETEQEVLFRPLAEIKASLALFRLRNIRQKIKNREGWLRSCLRKRWYASPNTAKQLSGYLFNSEDWLDIFDPSDSDWDFLRPYYQFVEGQIVYSE